MCKCLVMRYSQTWGGKTRRDSPNLSCPYLRGPVLKFQLKLCKQRSRAIRSKAVQPGM